MMQFKGFQADHRVQWLEAPAPPTRRLEFIGDSDTGQTYFGDGVDPVQRDTVSMVLGIMGGKIGIAQL